MDVEEVQRPFFESRVDDSKRWWDFNFHTGDIVLSARAKSGMTWVQTIVAMLVYQTTLLPEPLDSLSLWVDYKGRSPEDAEDLAEKLGAGKYRRVLKTHVPLGFLPRMPEVHYVSVVRDPLDSAVSSWYHMRNLKDSPPENEVGLKEWVRQFINDDWASNQFTQPLGVTLKMLDFLYFQKHKTAHTLVPYWELEKDLVGQIAALATDLKIDCSASMIQAIFHAVNLKEMRADAPAYIPMPDHFSDPAKFFRRGSSGEGREVASRQDYGRYLRRIKSEMGEHAAKWLLEGQ